MDFIFTGSTGQTVNLLINNEPKSLELLNSFAFNSDRKRMSVIVRDGGVIKMYVKGADNVIKLRLKKDE